VATASAALLRMISARCRCKSRRQSALHRRRRFRVMGAAGRDAHGVPLRVMAKARTTKALARPPGDSSAVSAETSPVAAGGAVRRNFEPAGRPRSRSESLGNWSPFAVLLGGPGRAVGRPALSLAPPVPRRTMPTSASFASAMPTVERPKDGRAREVGDGGFRSGGARLQRRPDQRAARLRSAAAVLAVIARSSGRHFPERRRGGDVALPSPRHLLPRDRPSSESAACRAAWRKSFRRSPRCRRHAAAG
jgi:hypothetical protein